MKKKQGDDDINRLKEIAKKIRRHVITMIFKAGSGHPGGSLSAVDIMVALYFKVMRHRPTEPKWPDRDRFVLSKGHAAPALYACLAESGYFPVEELDTLRQTGSRLQGHPDMAKTPGVEASTGSEGQGLSMGLGMALGGRLDKKSNHVFVMIGDGENDCGQIWEAAMAASFFGADNLIGILDRNRLQLDGPTREIMAIEPLVDKWRAFGWNVLEVDGHNMSDIVSALGRAKENTGKPTMLVANTVKGKGVSFMENVVGFHGKAPSKEQFEQAMKELGGDTDG
jgi:transketolase